MRVGAIVTYIIPAGDYPRKTKVMEAVNAGHDESVHDFYIRCCAAVPGGDVISIELKVIERIISTGGMDEVG